MVHYSFTPNLNVLVNDNEELKVKSSFVSLLLFIKLVST